jgi:hypothetical protein
MARRKSAGRKAEMIDIVNRWKVAGGKWPAPIGEITDFALSNGLYNLDARVRQMCAEELADAMREEYIHDADGRPVRKLHAARFAESDGKGGRIQKTLWADIDTADKSFMEVAFKQRRQQIVGDCRQLNNDVTYFNSKRPVKEHIQLLLDFRDDVAEGEMSDEYNPPPAD